MPTAAGAGLMRRVAFRFFLRVQIRRATDAETKAALKKLQDNRELLDAVADDLSTEFDQLASGPLTDFFDWLIANFDTILALVLKLIPLFV